jgi:hypothetical protein
MRNHLGVHGYHYSLIRKRAACPGANQISSPENGTHMASSLKRSILEGFLLQTG